MPPQNQNGPSAPNNPGQYDFFMNPQHPAKKPILAGPSSMKARIIVVVSGLVLLLILFSVVSAILNGGPTPASLQTSVVQDQAEIARVTAAATQNVNAAVAQNFAITAQFTITSAQQELTTYLATSKVKLSPKVVAAKQSAQTDQELASALSAGVYDQTFTSVMERDFSTYMSDLNTAYKKTKGPNGRKILQKDYASAVVLSNQLKNLPSQ